MHGHGFLRDATRRDPTMVAIVAGLALSLAACGEKEAAGVSAQAGVRPKAHVSAGTAAAAPRVTPIDRAVAQPREPADPSPALSSAGQSRAEKGEGGARRILATWAAALERRDWPAARATWGNASSSPEADPKPWARYRSIEVTTRLGVMEGAAGSLYYTAPVGIVGRLRDGRVVRMGGAVTLRRVNDVDGASVAQLRWHIMRLDLTPRAG